MLVTNNILLSTNNLCFTYSKTPVLKKIDFKAGAKQVISLIGPNGCGKSTLLRSLAGLLRVAKQSVFVQEKAIEGYEAKELARQIAFLPQFQQKISGISVYDLVSLGRSPYHASLWALNQHDKEAVLWAMDYMQVFHLKDRDINQISGGERQRVWMAMILAQDTPIILLDEPVTYMDLKHQSRLLDTIEDLKSSHGKTIVSVFHDINHAMEVSDFIYLMQDGAIHSSGTKEQVIVEQSIKTVYDVDTHICMVPKCGKTVLVPQRCRHKFHCTKNKHKHHNTIKNPIGVMNEKKF